MTGYGQEGHRFHHAKRPVSLENRGIPAQRFNGSGESIPSAVSEPSGSFPAEKNGGGLSEKCLLENADSRDNLNERGR